MPTHGLQFVALLVGTILIVGGLTFFPTVALGPVAEHFMLQAGIAYWLTAGLGLTEGC